MFSFFLRLFTFFPAGHSQCCVCILYIEIIPVVLAFRGVIAGLGAYGEREDGWAEAVALYGCGPPRTCGNV